MWLSSILDGSLSPFSHLLIVLSPVFGSPIASASSFCVIFKRLRLFFIRVADVSIVLLFFIVLLFMSVSSYVCVNNRTICPTIDTIISIKNN